MNETPKELPAEARGELITVVQLPIIKDQLRDLKETVDSRVAEALSLVCTEETVQTVKTERAALNKRFAELEERRKSVKAAVMGPYNEFERVYKECVSDAFKSADAALKGKISDVEAEQKRRCEDGLREYFAELCAVHRLDWLTYERAGIKVDMASAKAKTPGKLRKQLAEFVIKVNDGVNLIDSMEGSEEIMVEFRRTLDSARAIQTVLERRRRVEEERVEKETRSAARTKEAKAVQKVIEVQKTYLQPPVDVLNRPEKDPEETVSECTFTVYNAPRRVLWAIKEILEKEGIRYE